jgi:hypothetical protein
VLVLLLLAFLGSHTEVIRDQNGKEVHIYVCNRNNYTDSCVDNSGEVYIDKADGGR